MPLTRLTIPAVMLAVFFSISGAVHAAIPYSDTFSYVSDTVPMTCTKTPEIEHVIGEAISLGAPIYNEGLHLACYRIYEWAAYKILYEYGKDCKEVEKVLKAAIEKSHGDYSDTEKAWLMRAAFDKILGEPTRTGGGEKPEILRKG